MCGVKGGIGKGAVGASVVVLGIGLRGRKGKRRREKVSVAWV